MASEQYLTAEGRINLGAVMRAAHAEARANVARAAKRGVVRSYKMALKSGLRLTWESVRTALYCAQRDARLAALTAAHADLLNERTSALMIDSTVRMTTELAAIDARALAMGVRL